MDLTLTGPYNFRKTSYLRFMTCWRQQFLWNLGIFLPHYTLPHCS